ncbi:MAG: hypothetical protein QOK27_2204, partial [Gemmatimonadales bacterium]|nr:hypothetical protein [Gemmatimonadales bacterium]
MTRLHLLVAAALCALAPRVASQTL